MGLRFRRSASFGPFRITATRNGLSGSFGVRGARVGIDSRGRVRRTIGLPGTGIYDTEVLHASGSSLPTGSTQPIGSTQPTGSLQQPAASRRPWVPAIIICVLVAAMAILGVLLHLPFA